MGDYDRRPASNAVRCVLALAGLLLGLGLLAASPATSLATAPIEVSTISGSGEHSCAIRTSGQAVCWGEDDPFEFTQSMPDSKLAVPIEGMDDAISISVGGSHACAVQGSGQAYCWGENGSGQLGDGTTTDSTVPIEVSGLADAAQIDAGGSHTCAIRESGQLVCWGTNIFGQIGDGTDQNTPGEGGSAIKRKTPTAVFGTAIAVSAGGNHTCAIAPGGQASCWGLGNEGQVGTGQGISTISPGAVSGVSDAVEIAAGTQGSCAVRENGAAACWGGNDFGQLGTGSTSQRSYVPLAVSGLTDATDISIGYSHACAARESGGAVCWGQGDRGRLGTGDETDRLLPTPLPGLDDVVAVTAFNNNGCAIAGPSDNAYCWGANWFGQVGNDSEVFEFFSPQLVVGDPLANPGAPFSITPVPGVPGEFSFSSEVSDPDGDVIPRWEFGDGESVDLVMNVNHRYDLPGTYDVTHSYTRGGVPPVAETTKQVEVPAPELGVAVFWDEDLEEDGRLPLDQPIDVTVRVSAGADGVGSISGIEFEGDEVLVADPGDELVEIEVADPPEPFELEPGDSVDIEAQVTGVARGQATLKSAVAGTDAGGEPAQDDAAEIVRFGHDLEVTVSAQPAELELDEIDPETSKPKREKVELEITVENVSGEPVRDAKLDMAAIVDSTVPRNPSAPIPLAMEQYVDPEGEVSAIAAADSVLARDLPLGDLDASGGGATLEAKVVAYAQDKARVKARGIARGVTDTATPRAVSGNGQALVRIAQPRLLLVKRDPDAATSSIAGDLWRLNGTIENLSPDQEVIVRVLTHKQGNVIGNAVDDLLEPTENPIGLVRRLDPGERLRVTGLFSSDPDGGTQAIVDLLVSGWVDDEETQEEREVHSDEILVEDQAPGVPATRRRVAIDTTDPKPVPWSIPPELGWIFGDAFARGFGRWVDSTIELGRQVTLLAKKMSVWSWYLLATLWEDLDPKVEKELADTVAAYYAAVQRISLDAAKAAVDAAIQAKVQGAANAFVDGDVAGIYAASGGLLGEVVPELVIEAAVSTFAASRIVAHHGKNVLSKADEAQQATYSSRVAAKGLQGFEPGDAVPFHHARNLWGMDALLDTKLLAYAKKKGLVIAMRDRSPGSIKRIAEGALLKIEKVKSKNVSQLDVDYLGFDAAHLDFAMFKQMKNWDFYEARVRAANPGLTGPELDELLGKVKSRWWQRAEEYYAERAAMNRYAKAGKIPVPSQQYGMNPTSNGIRGPADKVWARRDFKLGESGKDGLAATNDGMPAFQPQVFGSTSAGTGFHPLTGDMDLIAIVDGSGNLLSRQQRLEVYRELADMGFQHPESLTWDNAVGRQKYLFGYDLANGLSEALLAYMPDGTRRAIKFDSRKSAWETDTGQETKGFLFMAGMSMNPDAPPPTPSDLPPIPNLAPQPEDVPVNPFADDETTYLGVGGDVNPQLSSDPGAPLVRQNLDGTFSIWTPEDGWVPYDPPTGGPIVTVPQTALTEPAPGGTGILEVIEPADLGLAGGVEQDWFGPGMKVVVNPGGATEETLGVAALGSIVLAQPLAHDHWPGETVAMVPLKPDQSVGGSGTASGGGGAAGAAVAVAPRLAVAPKISGRVKIGSKVTCASAAWTGTAPVRVGYTWQRERKGKWVAIPKARAKAYKIVKANAGKRIRCVVTGTNAAGSSARASAPRKVSGAARRGAPASRARRR